MDQELKKQIWDAWLLANYFIIVAAVLDEPEQASSSAARPRKEMSMFMSPQKKPRLTAVAVPTDGPVQFKSEQVLHTMELSESGAWRLEACVLYCPREPRVITVSNRYTGGKDNVSVITVMLAERTGPILYEAWRDAADKLARSCSEWEAPFSGPSSLFVKLELFEIK